MSQPHLCETGTGRYRGLEPASIPIRSFAGADDQAGWLRRTKTILAGSGPESFLKPSSAGVMLAVEAQRAALKNSGGKLDQDRPNDIRLGLGFRVPRLGNRANWKLARRPNPGFIHHGRGKVQFQLMCEMVIQRRGGASSSAMTRSSLFQGAGFRVIFELKHDDGRSSHTIFLQNHRNC